MWPRPEAEASGLFFVREALRALCFTSTCPLQQPCWLLALVSFPASHLHHRRPMGTVALWLTFFCTVGHTAPSVHVCAVLWTSETVTERVLHSVSVQVASRHIVRWPTVVTSLRALCRHRAAYLHRLQDLLGVAQEVGSTHAVSCSWAELLCCWPPWFLESPMVPLYYYTLSTLKH